MIVAGFFEISYIVGVTGIGFVGRSSLLVSLSSKFARVSSESNISHQFQGLFGSGV